MVKYRFVTPHRIGKWYRSLREAQQFACRIGAGFFHEATQRFVAYPGTELECRGLQRDECLNSQEVLARPLYAAVQNNACANAKSAHHAARFAERPSPIGSASL